MERNRTPGAFRLGIAKVVTNTGTQDIDFERARIHVRPGQGNHI